MLVDLIEWLAKEPASVGTFIGALVGSSLGLIALLLGALFNAHLTRVRDDRLRKEEARSTHGALAGELNGIRDAFLRMANRADENANDASNKWGSFLVPDITSSVRVMPHLLPKFGLLSAEAVREVIEAYVMVEQFRATLLILGGILHSDDHPYRGHIQVAAKDSGHLAGIARNTAKRIDAAIATLSAKL